MQACLQQRQLMAIAIQHMQTACSALSATQQTPNLDILKLFTASTQLLQPITAGKAQPGCMLACPPATSPPPLLLLVLTGSVGLGLVIRGGGRLVSR
mmetsp:Transcript_15767/g.39318  ORF Transcript_15767/g.39318 Transcript_15767/m.39318 type:complete len:97 (+) Transcript_15767:41-331(+)